MIEPAFTLVTQEGRLGIEAQHRPEWKPVFADWTSAEMKRRIAGGKRQLLARAVGLPRKPGLHVVDATAGLGRDGFTLAALGARVTLVERQPLVVALLRDALARVLADGEPGLREAASRVEIVEADAAQWLGSGLAAPDAVYLDPMYDDEGRRALPQKEMQLLRELNGGDPDAALLLSVARHRAARVAVKRPAKAPCLDGVRPAAVFEGTQARFDVYIGGT
ncbi:MAG TPA: class I SAM-dependent methyltransferase [Nevskiaceae bacterium]|nr:class I SAM-dependent methyltransferase [Nevskiaceae bacterium]